MKKIKIIFIVAYFRHKINLSTSSVKLNLSNRRVGGLLDFVDTFQIPAPVSIHFEDSPDFMSGQFALDVVPLPPDSAALRLLRSTLVQAHLARTDPDYVGGRKQTLTNAEMEK
jgi:hypothetical protein